MKLAELEDIEPANESSSFYVSFADLMMLLSVFFVMLIAMSKVETGLFEKVKSGITGTTEGTLVELTEKLKQIAHRDPGIPGVKIRLANDGVRLDLDTATLFATGSAVLKEGALNPLNPLFKEVLKTKYVLDIEGHTDDVRLYRKTKGEIESNWSLSGRRASVVIDHLIQFGFRKKRLRVVGYAETKPIVSYQSKQGSDLKKARSQNRRVSILVK